MKISKSLDTQSMPPATAKDVLDLVETSDFFHLPGELASPENAVDRFHYKISIADEKHEHTVEAGEAAVPGQLWPLLQMLESISRRQQFPPDS